MSLVSADRFGVVLALALSAGVAVGAPKPAAKPAAEDPAAPASAETPRTDQGRKDSNTARERMRPTGPVTITATNVDWAKDGLMVYTGNVKLDSDTLKLDGDRLELDQLGSGQFRAKVFGGPAHLLHQAATGADGKPEPEVTARGKTLFYDSKSGVVDINGDARATRGEDEITGETIHYNVNERRVQAAGGTGGPVRIVIQPQDKGPDRGADTDQSAPAPPSAGPAASDPKPATPSPSPDK